MKYKVNVEKTCSYTELCQVEVEAGTEKEALILAREEANEVGDWEEISYDNHYEVYIDEELNEDL